MSTKDAQDHKTRARTDETFSTLVSTGDFSLKVLDGPHEGASLHLEQELVRIGRAEWCDLVLVEDQWVSNIHCECWLDNQGVRLRDMHSRNGLLLDGNRIFDAYLREGAIFQVGRSNVQLLFHDKQRELVIQYTDKSGLLVGKSRPMRQIFSMLSRLADAEVNTMLTGETGTGKTSIAHAIHEQSPRKDKPFVTVNCGALPSSLIEAQLFGYEKGAFTGAATQHDGFFAQADGGTLFLDEIAELPMELQPKLLDVIERKMVRRLGGKREIKADFRLITATHRNLLDEIKVGQFREDLYFRLSVVVLEVPPLRERLEDLPLLVNKLLTSLLPDGDLPQLTEPAMHHLQQQLWPGNIRQLRNVLERAIVFLDGHLLGVRDIARTLTPHPTTSPKKAAHDLQMPTDEITTVSNAAPHLTSQEIASPLAALLPSFPLIEHSDTISLKQLLESIEAIFVAQALEETSYNAQEASKLLGISLGWLYNRARKYELSTKQSKK